MPADAVTLHHTSPWTWLWSPLGQWRTQMLWRLFGLIVIQALTSHRYTLEEFWLLPQTSYFALACGFMLLMFGPRVVTLAIAGAAVYGWLVPIFFNDPEQMIAEEYIVLLLLPAVCLLGTLAHLVRARSTLNHRQTNHAIDEFNVGVFRVTVFVALFFTGFHKLNHDFFNGNVTCAFRLARRLPEQWDIAFPSFIRYPKPTGIVLAELLAPLLLVMYPLLGIGLTVLILAGIGHIGAIAITMVFMMMACAFFNDDDGPVLVQGFKRTWPALLAVTIACGNISFDSYQGEKTWFNFFIYQSVILLMLWSSGILCVHRWLAYHSRRGEKQSIKQLISPQITPRALLGTTRLTQIILIAIAAALVFNSFTPYLGLKYRSSFAMLSNLRVDDTRWNHLLVPRWVYLREHDPFIHVTSVYVDAGADDAMIGANAQFVRGITEGLYSPASFKQRIGYYRQLNAQMDLRLRYEGQDHHFRNAIYDPAFLAWLDELSDSKMFQASLTARGAQNCVH